MKPYAILLSLVLAVAVSSTADAAKHHHHKAAATASKASTSDWVGNPYMDNKPDQQAAFFRDAFNPGAAK